MICQVIGSIFAKYGATHGARYMYPSLANAASLYLDGTSLTSLGTSNACICFGNSQTCTCPPGMIRTANPPTRSLGFSRNCTRTAILPTLRQEDTWRTQSSRGMSDSHHYCIPCICQAGIVHSLPHQGCPSTQDCRDNLLSWDPSTAKSSTSLGSTHSWSASS